MENATAHDIKAAGFGRPAFSLCDIFNCFAGRMVFPSENALPFPATEKGTDAGTRKEDGSWE